MQKCRGKLRPLFLSVVALASIACSPRPSESDARQMLESYLGKSYKEGVVRVVRLRKTDGLAEVENGGNYYTMDYEAEIVFPRGFMQGDYKAGEGYTRKGTLRFVRTEKGWRLVGEWGNKV